jgi:hypothetical protein
MRIANPRLTKAFIIVLVSILTAIIVIILLSSPVAKYLGKKYGEKYTGRQIKMGLVYVNPFTGYVHISNLVVYESKSFSGYKDGDSIFFSAKGVNATFSLLKFLSRTIEISEITLIRPKGIIIQNKEQINFSDWIIAFAPKRPRGSPSRVHFSILKIKIVDGEFHYIDKETPFNYFIRNTNIESTGKRWSSDTLALKYSFFSGTGSGSAKGSFTINFKNLDYGITTTIQRLDFTFLVQYLRTLVNYGTLRGTLEADIKASGNFKDLENIDASGLLTINDFHCGKDPKDDYAACDGIILKISRLSPKNHQYRFDSLSLTHPYFKYERYDYLDNLERMFGKNGTNLTADPERFNLIVTIARYIKGLAVNFFQSDYKINRLAIYKGEFRFNDFSMTEKFSVGASSLCFLADSINKNQDRVKVFLKSGIEPYGNASVTLSISPREKGDFDFTYHLQKVPVSVFNPYLLKFTSFPLDRGTLEVNGTWNVRKGIIASVNHLVVIDPRVADRLKNKDAKWIPLPLIMSLIREKGNVIDYEIPITGDLKNPKFHLHDVLMDLLTNIVVKPTSIPYRAHIKNIETEIEESLTLKWEESQDALIPDQKKFVGKMAEFLKKNPDATLSVFPLQYEEKEKEHIGFFEAKKKYFLSSSDKKEHPLTEADSVEIDRMSVKDSLFNDYLDSKINGILLFTVQEKCEKFIGRDIINGKFKQLARKREKEFLSVFREKSVENRVKFNHAENLIPYNGYSFYRIVYKGDLPPAITKAYRKMNDLGKVAPRKSYQKRREKAEAGITK